MIDLFGQEKILALSWKQPFGSAMLIGKVETRVWPTKYRGLVLICLSKASYSQETATNICGNEQFGRMCNALAKVEDAMDLNGTAIAVGRLIDCREMQPEDEAACFVQYRTPWVEDRKGKDGIIRKVKRRLYCHIYEDVRAIEPFPWKGCQGWADVPEEYKSAIRYLSTTGKPDNK